MSEGVWRWVSASDLWVAGLGFAAFLGLFWVLRGAPLGQAVEPEEDSDAPKGGHRDRVVATVTVGMLLILGGVYIGVTRGVGWSIPAFVSGFGTVLALVLINQKHRHSSPVLRRTLDVSTIALNASLFAGVLLFLNVLAYRYGGRAIDLTREGVFSLSSLSVNVVRTLDRPTTFTTFFGRSRLAASQHDRVGQLLELYRAANTDLVTLVNVDPFRDIARYEELVKRVPDIEVTQGGGVVIEYGQGDKAERVVVRNAELFEVPRDARFDPDIDEFASEFRGEDAITSALIRLKEGKKSRVVFITGHGEPSIDSMGGGSPGLGIWNARFEATGSEVRTVNLLTEEIPEGTALVVIAGPKRPFQPEEVARLQAYTDRKGPVLLLLGDARATGLDDFLRGFDLAMGQGFLVEPRLNMRSVEVIVIPVVSATHPILAPLNNEMLLFPRAAPVRVGGVAEPGSAATAFASTVLLRSSPESWAEPDLSASKAERDPTDEGGPLNVGLALTERPSPNSGGSPTPRLVLFSSRYLGDNASLQSAPANLDLLMNAASWLRGRPDDLGIGPKKNVSRRLTADPLLRSRLVLVPTVMSLLLIITLGLTTYYLRRQ